MLIWPEQLIPEPGLAQPIAYPEHDSGHNRIYLDAPLRHPIKNTLSEVLYSKSELSAGMVFERHAHVNDDLRIIVSGRYAFTIGEGGEGSKMSRFEAGPGDMVVMPAFTPYVEEVIEGGTVLTARFATALHYVSRAGTDTLVRGVGAPAALISGP